MTDADASRPVIDAVSAYQALADTDPIRVTLAVAATSVLGDEPLWLQLVGAPSSGKSEAIHMLADVIDGHIADVSTAGLLGWVGGPVKGRMTGLLARVGDGRKLVTITDFSTILADSDRGRRAQMYSLLRVMYDGYVHREIGSAPRPLEWTGRLTVISGVTPQIDTFSAHADALGPRWLYCRVPELDRGERKRAGRLARQHAAGKGQLRQHAQAAATTAIESARGRILAVGVNDVDGEWIDDAAHIATLARSDVPRDAYGAREISGQVTREEPPRVAIMLTILFRGLVALGLSSRVARRIVVRCALDSVPLVRRNALTALSPGDALTTSEVARAAGTDRKVMRFALEELELLGLVYGKRTSFGPGDDDEEDPANRRRTRNWTLGGDDGNLAAKLVDEASKRVEGVGRRVGYPSLHPPNKTAAPYTSSHPPTP